MGQKNNQRTAKRGFRFWLIRIGLGILILLIAPFPIGTIWQVIAQQSEREILPLGQLVDVNGHKMHIYCTGEGSPTVILEGGVPEWSIHWQKVQPKISKFTRVCSYDRAGYGWSEAGPSPRTAEKIVSELHTLLQNSGEAGPYVYVAHSFWGPAALLYQNIYPDEIVGMMLIETWSPQLFSPAPDVIMQSIPLANTLNKLAPLGQIRLWGELGVLPVESIFQTQLIPTELQPAYKAAYYDGKLWNAMSEEYSAMNESGVQTQNLASLGDLPLVVIKAGIHPADDYPPADVWDATQTSLAQLSSRGQLIIAENSGHFVQLEQPALVADMIQQVIEEVK
ncbi:MAG: alpha/beta hydrolase [Anaerolineales bacterium]